MDNDRFDALARFLHSRGDRRGTLAVLGGALGLLGLAETKTGHGKNKKKRRKKRRRRRPFCAGKNTCNSLPTEAIFCDGRAECFCWRTAAGGKPFCGKLAEPKTCGECAAGETCVNLTGTGIGCGADTGCAEPCPNPKRRRRS